MKKRFKILIILILFSMSIISCARNDNEINTQLARIDCDDPLISYEDQIICSDNGGFIDSIDRQEDAYYNASYTSFLFNHFMCINVIEPVAETYAKIIYQGFRTRLSGLWNSISKLPSHLGASGVEIRPDRTFMIPIERLANFLPGIIKDDWEFFDFGLEKKSIAQALVIKWNVPTGRYGVLPFIGPFYPIDIPDIILGNSLGTATQVGISKQLVAKSTFTINDHSLDEGVYHWITETLGFKSVQYTALQTVWEQHRKEDLLLVKEKEEQ